MGIEYLIRKRYLNCPEEREMNKTEEYLLIGGIVIFVVLLYLFMPGLSDEHEIQYSAQRTVTERPFFSFDRTGENCYYIIDICQKRRMRWPDLVDAGGSVISLITGALMRKKGKAIPSL